MLRDTLEGQGLSLPAGASARRDLTEPGNRVDLQRERPQTRRWAGTSPAPQKLPSHWRFAYLTLSLDPDHIWLRERGRRADAPVGRDKPCPYILAACSPLT